MVAPIAGFSFTLNFQPLPASFNPQAMETDLQAAHKKVYKKPYKKEEVESMNTKQKSKYDKKAPKFTKELEKLEEKRRQDQWATKQYNDYQAANGASVRTGAGGRGRR